MYKNIHSINKFQNILGCFAVTLFLIAWVQGIGFSEDFNDSLAIVINEQTAALLDVDNPIGFKIRSMQGNPAVEREYEIIGVVRNFHYMSLRDEISP